MLDALDAGLKPGAANTVVDVVFFGLSVLVPTMDAEMLKASR